MKYDIKYGVYFIAADLLLASIAKVSVSKSAILYKYCETFNINYVNLSTQ